MKTASDLVVDGCYLKAVIDAADFIDNEAAYEGSTHVRGLVTSLIHIAAKMADDMLKDIEALDSVSPSRSGTVP